MSKEAMKLALKRAFQLGQDYWYQADHESYRQHKKSDETLAKFRQLVDETCEALAKPDFWEGYVPEPVGAVGSSIKSESPLGCNGPTGPAQRPWVGLTDEEIWETVSRIGTSDSNVNPYAILEDARAIEAKLKEKNNG